MPLVFTEDDLAAQACVRSAFDPVGADESAEGAARRRALRGLRRGRGRARMRPGTGDAAVIGDAIPEGTWI